MFFINHHHTQVGHGGKERGTGAHHHSHLTLAHRLPSVMTLGIGHAAVQDSHLPKTAAEPADGLGRQSNFGHQHNGTTT